MVAGATCAIGVDVGGTKIEAILLDGAGHERWRERIASPRGDYDASLQAIAVIVNRARQAAGGAH
jgi:fructokinase